MRLQQHRAERRRQRKRDERREHGRHGDRHRELLVELPGHAGDEGHRDEHRREHQRDRNHRTLHLVHRLARRFARREPVGLHVVLDGLDDDDRVVDHDADREHHAEQRQRVDAEAEELEGREGRHQRHRHGEHRDQRRAPALQEQEHDDQHQDQCLDESVDHLLDRGFHELRCVVHDLQREPLRKTCLDLRELRLDELGRLERVCAGDKRRSPSRPRGVRRAGR